MDLIERERRKRALEEERRIQEAVRGEEEIDKRNLDVLKRVNAQEELKRINERYLEAKGEIGDVYIKDIHHEFIGDGPHELTGFDERMAGIELKWKAKKYEEDITCSIKIEVIDGGRIRIKGDAHPFRAWEERPRNWKKEFQGSLASLFVDIGEYLRIF